MRVLTKHLSFVLLGYDVSVRGRPDLVVTYLLTWDVDAVVIALDLNHVVDELNLAEPPMTHRGRLGHFHDSGVVLHLGSSLFQLHERHRHTDRGRLSVEFERQSMKGGRESCVANSKGESDLGSRDHPRHMQDVSVMREERSTQVHLSCSGLEHH